MSTTTTDPILPRFATATAPAHSAYGNTCAQCGAAAWHVQGVAFCRSHDQTTLGRVDLANTILDIVDREKRYVALEDLDGEGGDVEDLRMQLREVAFAILQGKAVKPSMLS